MAAKKYRRREYAPGRAPGVVGRTPPVPTRAAGASEADLGGDRGRRSVAGCETGPHSKPMGQSLKAQL